MSSNDGCFVGTMKSIILVLFIIAAVLLVGRELFTKNYVKVAKKSQIVEIYKAKNVDITYEEAFEKAFTNGEWKQEKKQKNQSYPPVIYTGNVKDSNGTYSVKYEFTFSNDLTTGFSTYICGFELNGEEMDISQGLSVIYSNIIK